VQPQENLAGAAGNGENSAVSLVKVQRRLLFIPDGGNVCKSKGITWLEAGKRQLKVQTVALQKTFTEKGTHDPDRTFIFNADAGLLVSIGKFENWHILLKWF